jgi:hypothetical protein
MTMKNSLILGLSLSLVACNCSDKAGGGAKGKAQSDTLAAMLTQMPSDDAGLVVAVYDVAGALAGFNV